MHAKIAVGLTLAVLLLAPGPAEAVPLGKEVDGQVLPGSVLSVSNDFYFKFNTFIDEEPGDSVAAPFDS